MIVLQQDMTQVLTITRIFRWTHKLYIKSYWLIQCNCTSVISCNYCPQSNIENKGKLTPPFGFIFRATCLGLAVMLLDCKWSFCSCSQTNQTRCETSLLVAVNSFHPGGSGQTIVSDGLSQSPTSLRVLNNPECKCHISFLQVSWCFDLHRAGRSCFVLLISGVITYWTSCYYFCGMFIT